MQQRINDSLKAHFPGAIIEVFCDGNKAGVNLICTSFEGKTKVQRHQMVYKTLAPYIQSGELHAVQIIANTPIEVPE